MNESRPFAVARARRTFVCLSSQRWSDGMWTNKQHVMSRLAREHRVIYVDFGTRPLLELARRQLRSALSGPAGAGLAPLAPSVETREGVTVLDFPVPRFAEHLPHGTRLRQTLEWDLRVFALGRWLNAHDVRDAIIWVYHPGYGDRVSRLPSSLVVYDCVDDYPTFPEFRRAKGWIAARERRLCAAADVIFCTARPLFEARSGLAPDRVHLIPNVGDAAHFARAVEPGLPLPDDVSRLPRPIVGFVGAVSNYKVNLDWLLHMARQRPRWSVVLVGPEAVADPTTDLTALRATPNVHLLGYRPYATLPAYLKAFDVVVIPYRLGPATRGVFPLKFFETLASGRPLVISRLPALADHYESALVADDADGFLRACETLVAGGDTEAQRDRRIALARRNTWDTRIDRMLDQIDRAFENRRAGGRKT